MLPNAERFFSVFANLPIEERKKTIVIINKDPITWDLARDHIDNETEKGAEILDILIELEII